MQYLVTDHEETRQQVLAAMSEAEGLARFVPSPRLRSSESFWNRRSHRASWLMRRWRGESPCPSFKSSPAPTPSFPLFC